MSYNNAKWVESAFELQLSEFQQKCVELICIAQGCDPCDLARTFETASWGRRDVEFNAGPLATHDSNGLTKLVIGAHELGIRVEIEPTMLFLRVVMSDRAHRKTIIHRGGSHSTIEQAVENFRRKYGDKL